MSLKEIDLVKLTKLMIEQTDHVTCLMCCKSYIAPATASCGHSLCHICWRGLRTCPTCTAPVDRKTLKLNLPLQALTEHVQSLGGAFEKLFNMKLDEFNLDLPGELEKDINKNVKDWLANSENQFSAPLTQQSSQRVQQTPNPLEISASNIQVHTHIEKSTSPCKSTKVVHIPPPQDDWDKIEPMTEPEINTKNKENIIGPMDIEPFYLEDSEYTVENPRRSSRKRELKSHDSCVKSNNVSTRKHSMDLDPENEKKSEKIKQTSWQNVKKMRKEFSKLNKQNRNKLNVSIELVKKTQNVNPNIKSCETEQAYNIDDKTPGITNKENFTVKESNIEGINNDENKLLQGTQIRSIGERQINEKGVVEDIVNHRHDNNVQPQKRNIMEVLQNNNKTPLVNVTTTEVQAIDNMYTSKETNLTRMPLLVKSSLLHRNEDSGDKISNNDNHKTISANTDDIEIAIKVGNTTTNIIIKKKENDVQVKVYKDCEIQTSLGNNFLNNDQSQKKSDNHMKINVDNSQNKVFESSNYIPPANILPKPQTQFDLNLHKSNSAKKNTASAETATVQFEITESVEKELSNIMECEERTDIGNLFENTHSVKNFTQIRVVDNKTQICDLQNKINENIVENYVEEQNMNDLDIFGSGSTKDTNVKLLSKPAPSEIFISTVQSKFKTQNITSKRHRDTKHNDHLPSNKKAKMYEDENVGQHNIEQYSEPINYDTVMDQVFANIDADIEDIRKSQKDKKANSYDYEDPSQALISKTQNLKNKPNSEEVTKANAYFEQKHSENVFSAIDKEDEIAEPTMKNKIPQQLEELLTPVLCRNLHTIQDTHEEMNKTSKSRRKSLQDCDDSDMSIVEETPQKDMSFSKHKRTSTPNRDLDQSQENLIDTKKIHSKGTSDSRSAINIIDTLAESNKSNRDVTVLNTATKKQILETPLTINRFVNRIKHKSTPVAKKSLHFDTENLEDNDPEQTLCPSSVVAKTTQEKEFLSKAFEKTPTPVARSLSTKKNLKNDNQFCLAGSCLSASDIIKLRYLCSERNWTYVDKYTREITHLVVGVDEENKSQRSVKYMCALAASKWIVSFEWVKRCLVTKTVVDEEQFEALDSTGEAGPRRSRTARQKLFEGITFFCMPPFNELDLCTLKNMLTAAGGRVASDISQVQVSDDSTEPALLLAEPEHTQEDRFMYLTMQLQVVPVNFEWVLNCLGSYTLNSVQELLLCPSTLLPPATSKWPEVLLAQDND